jgi:hypothetical protein
MIYYIIILIFWIYLQIQVDNITKSDFIYFYYFVKELIIHLYH